MKKIILVIMILIVQVSFAQRLIIKDKVDTLNLKVPSALPTEVGQVGMFINGAMSLEKVYTQSQVDNKDQDLLALVNRDYTTRTEYEELRLLIEALQDSITALRSSIGFITPTFPDGVNYFNASQDGSNIKFKWTKYDLSVVADSFEVVWSLQDPTSGSDPYSYTGFTTDTFYVITSPPTNTVYWGWVKAWKNDTPSNVSPVDSAFVYEAPTVNNWKYVSLAGDGDKSGVDSANAFAINAITGIVAGDTLVFLGGTYTTAPTINFSGTASELITLQPSYLNGVTFSGLPIAFDINDDYLRFKGFRFNKCGSAFYVRSGSNVVYIDSNYVNKPSSQGSLAFISGWNAANDPTYIDSVFIGYNTAIGDSQTVAQTDLIYVQFANNVFIQNNILEQRNLTGDQHTDCIQTANAMGNTLTANNKLLNLKAYNSQGMMTNTPKYGYWHRVYNNVVYCNGNGNAYWDYPVSSPSIGDVSIIHNTFYVNGAYSGFIARANQTSDSGVVCKNNIFISDGYSASNFAYLPTSAANINYNLYFTAYTPTYVVEDAWASTSVRSWTYWRGLGYDANSLNVNPLFTNATTDYTGLTLQAGSPAKNAGTNLQTLIESWGLEWKTIDGTSRDSSPDLGAY